jgi:hypothetical protein
MIIPRSSFGVSRPPEWGRDDVRRSLGCAGAGQAGSHARKARQAASQKLERSRYRTGRLLVDAVMREQKRNKPPSPWCMAGRGGCLEPMK